MSSDIQRDTRGRFTPGEDQSAPQADPRDTAPSTKLNAADGEIEESRKTTMSTPDVEPRGNDPWKSLATPGLGKSKIKEGAQEIYDEDTINKNLLEQLAQGELESARLRDSLSRARSRSCSSSDSEEERQTAEFKRKMRGLRQGALKEMKEREEEGDDSSKKLHSPPSSDSEDSSESRAARNKTGSKLLSKLKHGGEEKAAEMDEEPLELLWTFLDVKDINDNLQREDKNYSRTVDAVIAEVAGEDIRGVRAGSQARRKKAEEEDI